MRHRSHRPNRAYAAIPNAAMRDKRISIEARGLLALLMTYADDWTFVVEHLQSVAGVGRDKMRGMLKELEAAGYVVREVLRGDGGRLVGTEWMILDGPDGASGDVEISGKTAAVNRPPQKPSVGGTDDLIHRPPEKPTAGKSAPIRRTKVKKTNNPLSPPDGVSVVSGGVDIHFGEFWSAYPNQSEHDAARKAFAKVLASGEVAAEALVAAAKAYAGSREVGRGYPMKAANWLARGGWRVAVAGQGADTATPVADLDAIARHWAEAVKAGHSYCASAISATVARRMIHLGLVSVQQLRRVGVAI
ncbi:hypothetical protein ACEUZ9_002192 [Paracoccus litorisediminis]|uniref:hypothetical protein n=1 Tax=Paracoccus litorisediminis TaxID=2006130 RepID=UPI003733F00C